MSTKSETSWMPANGSHPVTVGSSLAGALKANKGLPQAPKLSDRGFYSFRYNFEPESIDPYKPGTIEVKREGDRKVTTIERASTVPGEGQLFTGTEMAAKDVDCVLVYDEELGTLTLEKLDSLINVNWGGKSTMASNRPSDSPSHTVPSVPVSPTKKENDIDLDLTAELERDLLSVVEDAPPRRPSTKQEPSSLKSSTSSTPNGTSGSQSLPKKPMLKREPKPKPKEPVPIFMNPNSAAARVANKKSAPPKQEPKPEKKPALPSVPTPVSRVAKLAGDLKSKGVKREAEPGAEGSTRVPKRSRPSPPPQKSRPQPRPLTSKPPALAAGLPPKPTVAMVPPPRPPPQPKPQPPAKKGFSLELPTGVSTASSSTNPLTALAAGSGGTSLSLPTAPSSTQPPPSTFAETMPVLSDSESEWDEVDAGEPSPPQPQPQTEPEPYRLGSLTIEEDPPAGFNGTLDIVEGDEDRYDDDGDADAEGDGEGVDIDMDDLMAEMDEQLQSEGGGGPEGDGDANDVEEFDFLAEAVSPEPEQDQEVYQDGGTDAFVGGDMFGDDDYSSSSDDSDD